VWCVGVWVVGEPTLAQVGVAPGVHHAGAHAVLAAEDERPGAAQRSRRLGHAVRLRVAEQVHHPVHDVGRRGAGAAWGRGQQGLELRRGCDGGG
jgi:hypothetical protein